MLLREITCHSMMISTIPTVKTDVKVNKPCKEHLAPKAMRPAI
uniref:Alternative protein n=1 Tax=Ascaris lumbricoides TaxID=6252 RepID=A0A0M3HFL8_ASCLU